MKVVFFGSPQFAVEILKGLIASTHKVVGVVCQPDRPANRNKLTACPVKKYAIDCNISVFDWDNVSSQGGEVLKNLCADIFVTAAYGQMLSQKILDIAPHGVINVHGSLLPSYRGASPVQSAILDGQTVSGVTIVKTQLKMDAGDIIAQKTVPICKEDTADVLFAKLAEVGKTLLTDTLTAMENNNVEYIQQDHSKATYCKKLRASDEKIDWKDTALRVCRKVKGLSSEPGAYTYFNGKRLKIFNCTEDDFCAERNMAPGEIVYTKKQMIVGCGKGCVALTDVQPSEGKRMKISDYLNGLKIRPSQMDNL